MIKFYYLHIYFVDGTELKREAYGSNSFFQSYIKKHIYLENCQQLNVFLDGN